MKRWRIVDCSLLEGALSAKRGALEVRRRDEPPILLPVADVAVVLLGINVHYSTAVIHRLLTEDIAVLFCDWKGVPEGAAYPWSAHNRVASRHRAQAYLSVPRQKNAWGRIIKAKVEGQANVLADHGRIEAREVRSLSRDIRSGDPNNIETRAARIYWQALWRDEGFSRRPGLGEGGSSKNSCLDYAYTVLRGHGVCAVLSAGLSPALGIFHRGRGNNFALVDDLIEPFRPAIDDVVVRMVEPVDLAMPEVRKRLVAAASRPFLADGRSIPAAFESLAQDVGMYMEGDLRTLPVPIWRGSGRVG